jgi:putative membrane protein
MHIQDQLHKSMNKSLYALFAFTLAVFIWSGVAPHDYFTWILEVFPAIIAAVILIATYKRFPLTTLAYVLICIHAMILMVGGHYTYAQVPLGEWMKQWFSFSRNHYDRIGHFAQGFVPAIIAREILIRTSPLRKGIWLFVICVAVCLSVSACYELLEWWVAVISKTAADSFLGTQGDLWDTQKDMLMALIGAVTALLTLSIFHNRQLRPHIRAAGQ